MFSFFQKLILKTLSPKYFLNFSRKYQNILGLCALCLIVIGVINALWWLPTDYKQSAMYRILYIHVPSAWLSLLAYAIMAFFSAIYYIWKLKVADLLAYHSALIGTLFTALTLITGAIWGKPAWGSFLHWDARIISEFILLLIYLSYIALRTSLPKDKGSSDICAVLAIIGLINLPIIKFSVEWWTSLHQKASIDILRGSIHLEGHMLSGLIIMWLGYLCYYFWSITCLTHKSLKNK